MQDQKNKLRSDDRVFKLTVIDDKNPISTSGLVDKRLFSGENQLHAIKEEQYGLWGFKYDAGVLPEPLKQKFTTFKECVKFADEYFNKRNIKITEIQD